MKNKKTCITLHLAYTFEAILGRGGRLCAGIVSHPWSYEMIRSHPRTPRALWTHSQPREIWSLLATSYTTSETQQHASISAPKLFSADHRRQNNR